MNGERLKHYRVLAKIGEGGMGEVYRAEDTRLGREVALKLLPPEMASSPDRLRRFRREARTVAALNHPNIVTLYSVDQDGERHFLTMELVRGHTLAELLPGSGFALSTLLDLALPLAEALATAHDRGIVHRDLKPGNVMVTTEGMRVKVLDFGLVKLAAGDAERADAPEVTQTATQAGTILGTPHYMSPEQARGESVDARSDVFSLGVMLYEMASGKRPFEGRSSIELLSAVLRDPVPPLQQVNPLVPDALAAVVERCLHKSPTARYPSAREVLDALRDVRREGGEGPTQVSVPPESTGCPPEPGSRSDVSATPRIAVLPLRHAGNDAELADLAAGLAEDISTALSLFSYLLVVSGRPVVGSLDVVTDELQRVGTELGAAYVIDGALRRAGSRIRITIQALDARSGEHLWADRFDRDLERTGVFEIQDEITDIVVATVADPAGVLVRSLTAAAASKSTHDLSPYEAVLRYFNMQQRVSVEGHAATRDALENALEREPEYSDAWAALAIVVLDEDRHAYNPRPQALDRALQAAQRAVETDPSNAFAFMSLAQVHYFRGEIGAFRSAAERAVRLNPRDGNTVAMCGILLSYCGDWERGVDLTHRAMERNPHHPGWYHFAGFFDAYRRKRYREALEIAQKVNLPEYFATHYTTAIAQAQLGNIDAARASAAETRRLWPDFERDFVSRHVNKWIVDQPELIDHVLEGLKKAGFRMQRGDTS